MMKKKLLLYRFIKLGGFLLFMMCGLLNAQTRNHNSAKTENDRQIAQAESPKLKADSNANVLQGNPLEAMKAKKEDVSKRDVFSKHYLNEDGTFTALIGAGPIHYKKNGRFLDIDQKITKTSNLNYPYVNETNLFESHFGTTSHQGVKNQTPEGEVKEFLNTRMYWEVNGEEVGTMLSADVPATIKNDKAYYDNLFGSISAEFTMLVGKRKLNYLLPDQKALGIIPERADYLVFSEDLVLPKGWVYTLTEDGILIKNQFRKEIYLYNNPASVDSGNEIEAEQNTVFETVLLGNILTIKTKVKTDWLLNSQRQFPVMIDPTVTVYPTGTGNYNTGSIDATGAKTANNDIYVGMRHVYGGSTGTRRFMRGWSSFNLTSVPDGSVMSAVTFGFYCGLNTLYDPDGQFIRIGPITSGIPNTSTGAPLYNMVAESGTNNWLTLSPGNSTGNMSIALINTQISQIQAAVPAGIFSLGFYPAGTYNTSYTEQVGIYGSTRGQSTSGGKPYLIITYTIPSPTSTLTVSNANSGASYANGSYTIANNTSVTATAGVRVGYNVTGWTGTGSVPATGTTGSSTFTITQNSTIDWKWQQIGLPNNITFHNYGGSEQLAFNNSRMNTTTPIFRLSHQTDPATDYEVEINTNPTFGGGTSWTQSFTGTYPINTENNFRFNNSFIPTHNTTYYVRVRVKGAANIWSAWTTETFSFTYDSSYTIPNWFQTTQAQFTTDALSGTTADANNDVTTTAGGNLIVNGNFANALTGWTTSKSYNVAVNSVVGPNNGCTNCSPAPNNFKMGYPWAVTGVNTDDNIILSQQVDLTNVNEIKFDVGRFRSFGGIGTATNSAVYFKIGGTLANDTGTTLHTSSLNSNGSFNDGTITINTTAYTGVQTIKFVFKTLGAWDSNTTAFFYVSNVIAEAPPTGTITSTPIVLSSVQNMTRFEKLLWNQTLGGGTLNFKIQQTTLGGTTWSDIAGYTNISSTGDGVQEFDLSAMTAYPQIRLVGTLNGANVKMHDWAVIFEEPCDKTWSSITTTNWETDNNWIPIGIPTAKHCVKIPSLAVKPTIEVGTSALAKNLTIESGGQLDVKGNITITDFIENKGDASDFIIESDANLIQINNVANIGHITLKRDSKMKRLDYIYWGSPVAGQSFLNFSPNTIASRFYRYNEEFDSFHTIANLNDPMIASEGYAIRAPNNQNATTLSNWTGIFAGQPNNGQITIPVTKHSDSPTDPNNPSSEVIARGKNMLANPYPSNLDLEALTDANPITSNGVYYFWTNTSDFVDNTQVPGNGTYGNYGSNHYATYNSAGAVPAANAVNGQLPTRFIRPGQGFLFEAKSNGTVTFNNTMRSAASNSNFISNKQTGSSLHRFWLTLTTPISNSNTLLIAYIPGATNSYESRYDARFPQKSSDRFYSILDDKELIIQGRQYPFSKTDRVPLGMIHFVPGNYKIEITDREGVFTTDQNIYLKDKQTGVIINLSQESYSYTAEAGRNDTRFEIIYTPETVLVTNERVKGDCIIYRDASDFVVKSSDQNIEGMELFDASGRLVLKVKGNNSNELRFRSEKFLEGIYVVKVITKAGVITKKITNH